LNVTEIFFKNMHEFPPKGVHGAADDRLSRCNLRVLKENIADGNYTVSAGEVAEKILSTQLFLFTHCC